MTTDKISCNILTAMLINHGVTEAVVSPGSRNAPMIVALARCPEVKCTVVIDERSAAFIALGKASVSGRPVALVCTSGSAVLNYAPAVAEAYYRQIPLIVISADRPMEWIDQDDSQTLRQYEALAHYVKRSYNLPADCQSEQMRWYVNRVANDAMICATGGRKAPVHINIQLDEPLGGQAPKNVESRWMQRVVGRIDPASELTAADRHRLADMIVGGRSVMVIAGYHEPNPELSAALDVLASRSNVVVMTERISNLVSASGRFFDCIDATLNGLTATERIELRPALVVTLGGAIVSRHVKQFLRSAHGVEHWHVGITEATIDCLKSLTLNINMSAVSFFGAMAKAVAANKETESDYADRWRQVARRAFERHNNYVDGCPWSDLTAMRRVMTSLPQGCNVQLSNGTSVRYAQLFVAPQVNRWDCNRGVSGIDGSMSTAVGASTAFDGLTVLITGDMSAQYDMGALAASCITPRLKIVVLCNGGGGIFRFVASTASLPELEEYLVVNRPFPLRQIAEAYGFSYYEAMNEEEFDHRWVDFIGDVDRPAIMALTTSGDVSTRCLKGYFT